MKKHGTLLNMSVHRIKGRTLALFSVGCVLGFFGAIIGEQSTLHSLTMVEEHTTALAKERKTLAMMCLPLQETNNIFFISCGGIY